MKRIAKLQLVSEKNLQDLIDWSDMKTLKKQVGGAHYKEMPIQPAEFIYMNDIGFFEGNVVKYVSRWRDKGGIADLEKAKHYIDMLIEFESR